MTTTTRLDAVGGESGKISFQSAQIQIDRNNAAVSSRHEQEARMQLGAAMKEIAALKEQLTAERERVKQYKEVAEELAEYAKHDHDCDAWGTPDESCGRVSALAKLEALNALPQ